MPCSLSVLLSTQRSPLSDSLLVAGLCSPISSLFNPSAGLVAMGDKMLHERQQAARLLGFSTPCSGPTFLFFCVCLKRRALLPSSPQLGFHLAVLTT